MNIVLTTIRQNALEREALAQSTTENPLTADDLAAKLLNSACDSYAASHLSADKAAMGANERLMALGAAVMARPDNLDAVEKAVQNALA